MTNCIDQAHGKNWTLYNGDSCEIIQGIPDNSIHYQIMSPPFSSLYVYSNSSRDLGNSRTYSEFYEHYQFLVREQYRVQMPGRLVSIHCMNLPTTKQYHGYIGIQDFRGDIIRLFLNDEANEIYQAVQRLKERANNAVRDNDMPRVSKLLSSAETMEDDLRKYPGDSGFIYHSEVCIWKDPVTAMQRTKAIGLLYKQLKKDSALSRQGIPDYLVTFRKPGVNPEPITKDPDVFPVQLWQRYASPVWDDINPSNTLQKESAREQADERHIAPLQLDVIERGIDLWSMRGDRVATWFAGIGSEVYQAVKMGRCGLGVELKESYFKQAALNCQRAEQESSARTLFDLLDEQETAALVRVTV